MKVSVTLAVVLLAAVRALGAAAATNPFEGDAATAPECQIDRLVFARLSQLRIEPANLCSDAVFVRRVYLDVIGVLPTAKEAREFIADTAPNKRKALIDRLLQRDEFADYWAMRWSDVLRVKAEFPVNLWPNAAQAYHRWIRESICENKPYDQFVREMLTASGSNFRVPQVNFYRAMQNRTPEGIAQAVALTFMGARADNWPKERLAGMAVFFAQVGYKPTREWKEEIVFWDPSRLIAPPAAVASGQTPTTPPAPSTTPAPAPKSTPPAPAPGSTASQTPKGAPAAPATSSTTAPAPKGAPAAPAPSSTASQTPKGAPATPAPSSTASKASRVGKASKGAPAAPVPSSTPVEAPKSPPAVPMPVPPPQVGVFPDGTRFQLPADRDPREFFAGWLVDPKNPWFTRSVVNRVWCWLLGRGIIHEPDDIRPDNPPSNPALLAYLQQEFVTARYDLKHIYRLILNSKTYQLSSIPKAKRPEAEVNFAHYPLRRLDAEVLIDAINKITGTSDLYTSPIPEPFTYIPRDLPAIALADGSITSPFLALFGRSARASGMENERENKPMPAQSLHMLNSSHIQRKLEQGPGLKPVFDAKRKPAETLEELYLTVLSRFPTPEEVKNAEAYAGAAAPIASGKSAKQAPTVKRDDWIDITWSLINSVEFLYRH